MSNAVQLRPARPGEEDALSELCLRSKAHWGYGSDFMAAVAPHLKVTPEAIATGRTVVAELNGAILGVCQIEPGSTHGTLDLLFITPDAIGHGVGRILFNDACKRLKAAGETIMTILSDPDAEAAYIHMGARRVEMRPSDVFKGRELPWLEMVL
jgi:GNAT superfamily N-acetyltransferase